MSSVVNRREFIAGTAATALAASFMAVPEAGAKEPQKTAPPYKAPSKQGPLSPDQLVELEEEASKLIPKGAFAYIARGAEKEWTLKENMAAFDRITLLPKYLSGKPKPDLSTDILGHTLSMPVITTPMGAHGLAHTSAETGTAKGTAAAGTLYTLSTASNTSIEDVARASNGPKWFQIYLLENDRPGSEKMLKRAEAAGFSAIVFTIDAFAPGSSDAAAKLSFSFPPSLAMVNSGTSVFKKSLSWDDVAFIRDTTKLPLVIKGAITPGLAEKAVKAGAAAIQVSNHGGRQLDGVPAAITALPEIAKAVGQEVPVLLDSGIRRGSDVFKALALGASAVAVGRPLLYGLALGGADGVASVYAKLKGELERTMLIAGAANIKEISGDFLA